jgi:DNA-binding PadR family transcriptional regulator
LSQQSKSSEDITEDLTKDILRSHLNILILTSIRRKGELSGYDLFVLTRHKFDIVISVGNIYAQLYALERKCWIAGRNGGSGARKYSLTPEGIQTTDIIIASKKRLFKVMDSIFEG